MFVVYCCQHTVRAGVYCKIGLNFVGGATLLLRGILFALHNPHQNNPLFLILPAVFLLIFGVLLLVATVQDDRRFVLAYLILTTPSVVCVTIYTVAIIFYRPQHGFLFLVLVMTVWPAYYCVYKFYRKLVKEDDARTICENLRQINQA